MSDFKKVLLAIVVMWLALSVLFYVIITNVDWFKAAYETGALIGDVSAGIKGIEQ